MKHVVVTGGAGFIPSHLCETLLKKGYVVTAIDNFATGRAENLADAKKIPGFHFIEADVSKPWTGKEFDSLKSQKIHGIFHMASPASPLDFDKIPIEILEVNSLGTMHAVRMAKSHGARFLLASTSEIYGDPLLHPQPETYWGNVSSIGPRACYDESKRFGEAYVSTMIRIEKFNAAIVRIFNTYGPRMRPDDGRIVPELCMQGLEGKPLTVHGDGKQTRSFCYVTDLVDGIIRLFESELREPVNIGNPVERTVLDFAKTVLELTGKRSKIQFFPGRPEDPRRRCPDISKARSLLKWEPKVDFREGLKQSLKYFEEQRSSCK